MSRNRRAIDSIMGMIFCRIFRGENTRKIEFGGDKSSMAAASCRFCGYTGAYMAAHYVKHHRFSTLNDKFICGYCFDDIDPADLKTHGMETCCLCRDRFQHRGVNEYEPFHRWGMIMPGLPAEHPDGVSRFIEIYTVCHSFAYLKERVPDGPVCSKCIGTLELLPLN